MAHVIVPEQTPKLSYSVTTPEEDTFNINFVIFESDGSDIDVFDIDVLLSPTLYTITPFAGTEGGADGGTLVLNTPVIDTTIVIVRNIALERTSDFPTAGPFNINALNTELDRMAGMIQQIREAAAVSFGEAISVVEASNLQIKEPASIRGGKVLGFDANGDLDLQTGVGLWRDNWVTSTFYGLRDVVRDDAAGDDTKNLYICVIEHTSGTWSTDLAANNWDLMVDVESVTISETNAAASEAAASVSETNAATSETNAATSETNAAISAASLPDLAGSSVNDMIVVNSGKTGYNFTPPFTDVVQDTTPQLGGFLDPNGNYLGSGKGSDLVSASSLVIGTDGDYFDVTGTTNIGSMVVASNRSFRLRFDDTLTIFVGAGITLNEFVSWTTRPGDIIEFYSIATDTVIATISPVNGTAPFGGGWLFILGGAVDGFASISLFGLDATSTIPFEMFVMVLTNVKPVTDSVDFILRVGDSSGIDSGSADYSYHTETVTDTSTAYAAVADSSSNHIKTSSLVGSGTGEGYNAIIYFNLSSIGSPVSMISGHYTAISPSNVLTSGAISGRRKAVIDMDRIQIGFNGVNMASGLFSFYGLRI